MFCCQGVNGERKKKKELREKKMQKVRDEKCLPYTEKKKKKKKKTSKYENSPELQIILNT